MDYKQLAGENQYGDWGGLSKSHNSPDNDNQFDGYRINAHSKNGEIGTIANLTVWKRASLVRVQRDSLKLHRLGGGVRGTISGFSENSRRRLQYKLASLERGGLPVLVTLTYPDSYYEKLSDFHNWKRDIDAFGKRVLRQFDQAGIVWKMEVVSRKSGLYVGQEFPHFHCLIWGVKLPDLLKFVPGVWFRVVSTGDLKHLKAGTRVEQVRSENGVRSYVSKYICKTFERRRVYAGRWWGWIGKKNLPFAAAECIKLCDFEAELLICALVRRMSIFDRHYKSLFYMCDADQVRAGWEDVVLEGYIHWEVDRGKRKTTYQQNTD